MRHCIKDKTVGEELGVHILITEILTEIYIPFGKGRCRRIVTYPHTAGRGCRDVYECGTRSETEVHTPLRTAYVHILYVRTLGEMLHIGGTIEDRIDRRCDG